MSDLLVPYLPSRPLRSSTDNLLTIPSKANLKTIEKRLFSIRGPKEWNDLPSNLRRSKTVDVFKSRLKTYLFSLAHS